MLGGQFAVQGRAGDSWCNSFVPFVPVACGCTIMDEWAVERMQELSACWSDPYTPTD